MPNLIHIQTSFSVGEISPTMYVRLDVPEIYGKALKTATNVDINTPGEITTRAAFKYVVEVADSSKATRTIPFRFDQGDSLALEFGEYYIRFIKNKVPITEDDISISGITEADPGVVTTSSAHGLSNGDWVYITEVVGMTEVNSSVTPYVVANKTSTTFELTNIAGDDVDTSAYTTYSSGGVVNKIYEVATTYTEAELFELDFSQKGNVVYITQGNHPTATLIRTSDTNWTLSDESFSPEPSYETGHEPDATLTPSATTGNSVTFTASTGVFVEADVSRQIINNSTDETGVAVITEFTSSTVVTARIITDFTDTNAIASGDWKLDLSPRAQLKIQGFAEGSGSDVRLISKFPPGSRGDAKAISNISTATSPVVTYSSAHGFSQGENIEITGLVGMTELNDSIFKVYDYGGSTQHRLRDEDGVAFSTATYGSYVSGGYSRQVFDNQPIDAFRSEDVGKYVLINDGVLLIEEYLTADEVSCRVLKPVSSTDSSTAWTLEEPTWTASRGYPKVCGFYEGRLILANTDEEPIKIWMSETGIYNGIGEGSLDSDAISVEIATDSSNNIKWLGSSESDLFVGTSNTEVVVDAPSTSAVFSPSNKRQSKHDDEGSVLQHVESLKGDIIFKDRFRKKLLAFFFNVDENRYRAFDLSKYARHIFSGTIVDIATVKRPDPKIYCVLSDGTMVVCLYDRSERVLGWTRYVTDGSFESVCSIPGSNQDDIYVVVNRTINGSTKRYIEVLDDSDKLDLLEGCVDSYLTYQDPLAISGITKADPGVVTTSSAHGLSNGDLVKILDAGGMTEVNDTTFIVANKTSTTFELTDIYGADVDTSSYTTFTSGGNAHKLVSTITGLDHLEGESLTIKADGSEYTSKTVTSGSISLDEPAHSVIAGLPYTATVKTLPPPLNYGAGYMVNHPFRFLRSVLVVRDSAAPTVNGDTTPTKDGSILMSEASSTFTGALEYSSFAFDDSTELTITYTGVHPIQISGLFLEAEVHKK